MFNAPKVIKLPVSLEIVSSIILSIIEPNRLSEIEVIRSFWRVTNLELSALDMRLAIFVQVSCVMLDKSRFISIKSNKVAKFSFKLPNSCALLSSSSTELICLNRTVSFLCMTSPSIRHLIISSISILAVRVLCSLRKLMSSELKDL